MNFSTDSVDTFSKRKLSVIHTLLCPSISIRRPELKLRSSVFPKTLKDSLQISFISFAYFPNLMIRVFFTLKIIL